MKPRDRFPDAETEPSRHLVAARALIREKGYERTTLEAVARRAGMTTGAIYGNFKNRDELFIALGQKFWAPVKPEVKPGATFADAMPRSRARRSPLSTTGDQQRSDD